MKKNQYGVLYIVATPIGNLQDITLRAIEILKQVDVVIAEDTRKAGVLLNHFSIKKPTFSLHDHNERDRLEAVINQLLEGHSVALISDAGTPLINDPGYLILQHALEHDIKIIPIPGACALITALCASGLPTQQFLFAGFLPAKTHARQKLLTSLKEERSTLIFYEAPHRLIESLEDLALIFGERKAVVARELTKIHEGFVRDNLPGLKAHFIANPQENRGEIVLLVAGYDVEDLDEKTEAALSVLDILMSELSPTQSVHLASKITGLNKNVLYKASLQRKKV